METILHLQLVISWWLPAFWPSLSLFCSCQMLDPFGSAGNSLSSSCQSIDQALDRWVLFPVTSISLYDWAERRAFIKLLRSRDVWPFSWPHCEEKESGHSVVAIATILLSGRLDSCYHKSERLSGRCVHTALEENLRGVSEGKGSIWIKAGGGCKQERGLESRTETVLPARGLSGLRAAEQWQETNAWNFSLRTGMRAPYPGSRGPAPPFGQQRRHSAAGRGFKFFAAAHRAFSKLSFLSSCCT